MKIEEPVMEVELPGIGEGESIKEIDDSQLVGATAIVASDHVDDGGAFSAAVVVVNEIGVEKRKRGRPPRGQAKTPILKVTEEEEDVCFICFDGGSLVLCDRRGCPKAYHPACIKRDEAFFQSKAKWNCGWHICSSCRKASYYMCYTCTFSLCKGCTKDAEYVSVRGNKGFCTTCLRTIFLIENNEPENKEMAQVDFDDKSSWEYLFKVYWVYLKEKLSLTLSELNQAKSPWTGSGTVVCSGQQKDIHHKPIDEKDSLVGKSSDCLEVNSKRRKTTEHLEYLNRDSQSTGTSGTENRTPSGSEKGITSVKCTEWATTELLEFVALMKNGDTTVLSQFDAQSLLLEYIKRNNLRDPRRKSEIICDSRLISLFGKSRVGHIEMLKLLEFHFLIKEESQKDVIQCSFVDGDVSQMDGDGNHDTLLTMGRDKRRKTRKKGEEQGPQINLGDYAAIDVHNIKLIYLRRDLMESLVEDTENFHDKVVSSIVRIRISSSDQKQDMYRLVQVVGTSKVTVPYTIGKKTADVMLEILNLDKKEAVSIDAISNQEFSEDECNRLRQSIKCGLVKRLTVGDIQKKAIALQAVRINDWLETEVLRLNHLRDRASEKGHKRELREYVERIQLLKTPEERQRRLHEIPVVHADTHMDPNYESEEDDIRDLGNIKKQAEYASPKYSGFSRKRKDPSSQKGGGEISKDSCNRERKSSINIQKSGNPVVDTTSSMIGSSNNQAGTRLGSSYGNVAETATSSLSSEAVAPLLLWHYRDPNGKIQGPFSVVQLRKWSTTGYFPPDMRIWGIHNTENESILLTDVLKNPLHTTPSQLQDNVSQREPPSSQSRDSVVGIKSGSDQVQNQLPSAVSMNSGANQGNLNSHGTPVSQITGGKSHENSYYNQGSGQNWRPLSVNVSSTDKDSSSSIASVAKSIDTAKQSYTVDIPDLPSPTPKTSNVDWNDRVAENKQCVSSSNVPDQESHIPDLPSPTPVPRHGEEKSQAFPIQDSGPSWSCASSPVVGNGARVRETLDEWGGSSPTPAKPSDVEEWESTLASASDVKVPEVDHRWRLIIGESIEFTTLAEESVSDLLAEVDAMESQCELASPTSVMNCGEELIEGSENDCFSSMGGGGLSPTPGHGKSDALSSTGDAQFPEPRLGWGGGSTSSSVQGVTNPGLDAGPETSRVNLDLNTSLGLPAGRVAWDLIQNGAFPVVNSGNSRGGKNLWSRQLFGGGGQNRVCKFYESGCCKKGAACAYLHPGS